LVLFSMTTKNIKAILFASLIVALVLPFSAMSLADAASNEKADEKAKKQNADRAKMAEMGYDLTTGGYEYPNEARDSMLAQGFELYPGVGWIHKDRIQADPVWMEHPNGSGEMILDGWTMKKQYDQLVEASGNGVNPVAFGASTPNAYEIAVKDNSQNDITYSKAYWNVPDSPTTYDGGTNFNFNAVQPSLSSIGTIFQPVLQHGSSNICAAGDNWVTHPFMMLYGHIIDSDCVSASEGDLIRGIITKDTTYDVWTVSIKNYANSAATDSVSIGTPVTMTALFTAIETWNIPTNCSELQGDVQYKWMSDSGDVDSWDTKSGYTPFCGMDTNIVSDSTVNFNNNN